MVKTDIRPMTDEERKRAAEKQEANQQQESYHNYIKRMYKEYDKES